MTKILRVSAILLTCWVVSFGGAFAETVEFPLGEWGSFELEVPDEWSSEVSGPVSPSGTAIKLTPRSDLQLVLLITPIPVPDEKRDIDKAVEELAKSSRNQLGEVAVEKKIQIEKLSGTNCRGLYASATDRTVTKPSADNFKYASIGAVAAGRLLVTFTILTNVEDAPERAQALTIVASSRHRAP